MATTGDDGEVAMAALAKRWFSCLCISLAINLSCAIPSWANGKSRGAVDIVYRFDTRPPNEIFANGFAARGNDKNLIQHVLSWTERSAFIATTSSYDIAGYIARADLTSGLDPRAVEEPEAIGYIYGINPSGSFYQVMPAMERFLEQQRALPVAMRNQEEEARLELAMHAYGWEREYVSIAPIPATSVVFGVQVSVRRENGRFLLQWGEFRTNPNEDAWDETTNPHNYADDHSLAWPETVLPPPSSDAPPSCEDASRVFSGAIGMNCSGDLYAAVSRGAPIHQALLPSCRSPVIEKRIDVPLCFGPMQLVNISKLARLRAAELSEVRGDEDAWLAQDGPEHDEL